MYAYDVLLKFWSFVLVCNVTKNTVNFPFLFVYFTALCSY